MTPDEYSQALALLGITDAQVGWDRGWSGPDGAGQSSLYDHNDVLLGTVNVSADGVVTLP